MNRETLDPESLYQYRLKLYRDTMNFKKTERFALYGNLWSWKFLDAGYTVDVAARDYDILEKCVYRAADLYEVDCLADEGFRNPLRYADALGGSNQYVRNEQGEVNVIDASCMDVEDYDAFTANLGAAWYTAFFKKYPKTQEMSAKELADAAKEFIMLEEVKARVNETLRSKYGVIGCWGDLNYMPAIELLFLYFRGIKALSMDLRRHKDKVDAFCDAVNGQNMPGALSFLDQFGPRGGEERAYTSPIDIYFPLLAHTILNRKQFEKYVAEPLRPVFEKAAKLDVNCYGFAEGSWGRFAEFFNEFGKGTVSIQVETDDIYELRKNAPDICLWGGLDATVMASGTVEENIDMTKRLMEEVGADGGLVLSPSKMISYANDMNPENLKAVADFVSHHKIA